MTRTTRQLRRPGMSSVLAMLYLVLFSSLAVGFYAATTTAVQVSDNEVHARQAMLSAESGMAFLRYVMGNVDIPHSTPTDQAWTQFCTQVKLQLDNTTNVGNRTLTLPAGEVWTLPTMSADSTGATFNATLTHAGEQILVKVSGKGPFSTSVTRTLQLAYARAQRASAIFDYGVASKSAITMAGSAKITGAAGALARGSVLSMTAGSTPLSMTGNPSISGDFSYTNPAGNNVYGNGTIAGYKTTASQFADHVHAGVQAPEFPTIDTSAFAAYVPSATAPAGPQVITSSNPPGTSFTNIRIKANANPKFNANTVIRGVVYIETPNKITFNGNATVQGVIVAQNNPTGSVSTNILKFNGNLTHQGVETLDPTVFGDLTKLKGSFLLAPSFEVDMSGNNSNVGGTIVTSKLDVSGNAGANVNGTVINIEDTAVNLTGSADIIISSTGTTNYPAGVFFGSHYAPLPDTYQELP